MNINQWRSGLKNWLQTKLLVDTWELRNPTEYGTINAFIPPIQNIEFTDDAIGQCAATCDFYVTSRYRGDVKYINLPLGTMEQLHVTISRRLSKEYYSIAPLLEFKMKAVTDSVQVMEYGDQLADWLVTLVFSAAIVWVPDDGLLPGDLVKPPVVYKLTGGLYTEKLPDILPDKAKWSKVGDISLG